MTLSTRAASGCEKLDSSTLPGENLRSKIAWIPLATALFLVSFAALPGLAANSSQRKQQAQSQFEAAERMREALNGRPEKERTAREYKRVEDAYRRVYHLAPNSSKAVAGVVAVAELLAEQGHTLDDDSALEAAIGQYRFLRREYPGSKHRVQALLTIGQIYKDDLNDPEQARTTFDELLKLYPHAPQAAEASKALEEIKAAAEQKKNDKIANKKEAEDAGTVAETSRNTSSGSHAQPKESGRTGRPLLTGIRHWSTPDYTRVAIDLEAEVKYEGWRIPSPDRIYFDLKDTRLASTLVGKSFDVEDGFLKKIRVAQYLPDQARVVLDVDDVSEYSAFLLPNPYRLIIDIHGKKPGQSVARAEQPLSRKPFDKSQATSANVKAAKQSSAGEQSVELAAAKSANPPNQDLKSADAGIEEKPEAAKSASAGPAQSALKTSPSGQVAKTIVEADDEPPSSQSKEKSKAQNSPSDDQAKANSQPQLEKKVVAKVTDAGPSPKSRSRKGRTSDKPNAREAQPTLAGDRSLTRALGLKIGRIVVDAGHGGHDTGTIGPHGLEEKDLVLDVSLRLGKLLENRLGAEVIYTRDDDTFIPLETRTAIANQHEADLFISVHANSSRDPGARGVETYYLNFTSSRDALEVAARENAVSEKSIHELQDLVKKIALKEKIEESREFAFNVQQAMHSGLSGHASSMRDRGVKKAPFIVLIGANMPSILAEISFISNPGDEKKLQTPEYRQKIAESLFRGISKYVNGLSGIKVATKMSKAGVQ
ncbi:MAG TPA: N-acetylmuramoyl-L-alanine amidase [Terriglobales bacterium]|nr:N-acetylmuramoyl-L-alanine amidase [Terriglobales bacterium]